MIRSQVLNSIKWLGLARLAGQGTGAVVTVIVVRLLDPADYGVMAVALVFLGLNPDHCGKVFADTGRVFRRALRCDLARNGGWWRNVCRRRRVEARPIRRSLVGEFLALFRRRTA